MANVTLNGAFSFLDPQGWSGFSAVIWPNSIEIDQGGLRETFYGAFTYDSRYNVHGTVTSVEYSVNGVTGFTMTDVSASAGKVQQAINGWNSQALYAVLLGGSDSMTGSSGNDYLVGYAGNDTLDGGSGSDTLAGGAGDDTYVLQDGSDTVVENASAGRDTVQAYVSYVLGANLEKLTLLGADNLSGTGNALKNVITGNTGSNTLTGVGGGDTLIGGRGDDVYVVQAGDVIVENAGEGIDTVLAGYSYTLRQNLENLTLFGTAALKGTGNALDNRIIGNDGANALSGGLGNDTLDGGAGADKLTGGAGNDTYVVDNTGDVIIERAGQGLDTVQSSISYRLADGLDNLTLTGLADLTGTGNAASNVLIGNSGNNTLVGGGGNDTFDGGSGVDTVWLSGNRAAWSEPVVSGTTATINRIGTTETVSMQRVEWLHFDDVTIGLDLPQVLIDPVAGGHLITGWTGNDTIDGGDGADTMLGGAGDDLYYVDDAGDVITEDLGAGIDSVLASVSVAGLAANVENLTLAGSLAIDGVGNALNNIVTGNGANNRLDGGAGIDTLVGGSGNDIFVVDTTTDVILDSAGVDGVESSIDFSLAALSAIENLTLTGTALNATGNSLDNALVGNAANNELDGGAGADTLAGGAGDDLYVVDNVGDVVVEDVGAGNDTVQSSVSFTLSANVENLTLTGSADINGTGNALDNILTGNSGSNILSGGAGNDTYMVDSSDRVVEDAVPGVDTAVAAVSWTLGANVENLTLSGTGSVDGTGNAMDNVIVGNDGNNHLDGGSGNDSLVGGAGNDTLDGGGGGMDTLAGGVGDDVYIITRSYTPGLVYQVDAQLVVSDYGTVWTETFTPSSEFNWSASLGDRTGDGLIDYLSLYGFGFTGDGRFFNLDLATNALDQNLASGTYLDAERAAFASNGHPGLDLGVNGYGYNTLSGEFTIQDIQIDYSNPYSPTLVSLDATFTIYGWYVYPARLGTIHYALVSPSSVVQESAGEGIDTVQSSMDYTLTANVENLVLTDSSDIDGTGNELANVITGNGGANVLDGGVGADTLAGGAGDDSYWIDNVGDAVIEASDGGIDLVNASVSYVLAANVEDLTLTGASDISATGNTLNNALTGNAGNNLLVGGGGSDTLAGGAGNDTYIVDSSGDCVIEEANQGVDTVLASVSCVLGANVEKLTLSGTGSIDGTGNATDNVIVGNDGNNYLDGGSGNDSLVGGAGNDTLDGGCGGTDTLAGGAGDDVYIINSSYIPGGTQEIDAQLVVSDYGTVWTQTFTASPEFGWSAFLGDRNGDGLIDYLSLYGFGFAGDGRFCSLDLATNALDQNLASGTYLDAERAAFASNGHPGLDLGVNGSGYNTLSGEFAIQDIQIDYSNPYSPTLVSLDATFTIYGWYVYPARLGTIHYALVSPPSLVEEFAGEGTDTVQSSMDYTLTANVENLMLTGFGDIDGTGNELANRMTGNSGDNVLVGGAGADTLEGGAGGDIFRFSALSDSGVLDATRDVITDFLRGEDRIDLSLIDADAATAADDAFSVIIGSADAFSAAGQLKLVGDVLYGNTDADADAEFAIQLTGITTLETADFIL